MNGQTGVLELKGSGGKVWLRCSVRALVLGICVVALSFFGFLEYELHHLDPLLRGWIQQSLQQRFGREVALDRLQAQLGWGTIVVHGGGLRVASLPHGGLAPAGQGAGQEDHPLLTVPEFEFTLRLRDLLDPRQSRVVVKTDGMVMDLPPAQMHPLEMPAQPAVAAKKPSGAALVMMGLAATNAKLILENQTPGHTPLEYDFSKLVLKQTNGEMESADRPVEFKAWVHSDRPSGEVATQGHFGPWQKDNTHSTHLDGEYQVTAADLTTISGLGGMASSSGRFDGTLGRLAVNGVADSNDFRMDVSAGPMRAHIDFESVVDGTSGELHLEQVHGLAGDSAFTATGTISRTAGVTGRNVTLEIDMPRGRTDDMLRLFTKKDPPIMHGTLSMKAHLAVPASPARVIERLQLTGTGQVTGGVWSSGKVQQNVDEISARGLGQPKLVKEGELTRVTSTISGSFNVAHAIVDLKGLAYQIPGVTMLVDGNYALHTDAMDFVGLARSEAKLSNTETGIKHVLLKPVDPFFHKDGVGMEIPVHVHGASPDIDFSFDLLHGKRDKAAAKDAPQSKRDTAEHPDAGIRKR